MLYAILCKPGLDGIEVARVITERANCPFKSQATTSYAPISVMGSLLNTGPDVRHELVISVRGHNKAPREVPQIV